MQGRAGVRRARASDFLTAPLSSNPAKAGVGQGIVGTAILGVIVALLAFPFGIATAVYLEEYAGDTKLDPVHPGQHPQPGGRARRSSTACWA